MQTTKRNVKYAKNSANRLVVPISKKRKHVVEDVNYPSFYYETHDFSNYCFEDARVRKRMDALKPEVILYKTMEGGTLQGSRRYGSSTKQCYWFNNMYFNNLDSVLVAVARSLLDCAPDTDTTDLFGTLRERMSAVELEDSITLYNDLKTNGFKSWKWSDIQTIQMPAWVTNLRAAQEEALDDKE